MENIIPIFTSHIGTENVNSVNAREIHAYLEVKTAFSHWIKRAIEKYDFFENEDYTTFITDAKSGKRDYIVSMDMAKELSMLENNPKGKETRKYFIQAEKQSQKVLTVSEQIVLLAQGHQEIDSRLVKLEETRRLENWQEKSIKDAVSVRAYALAGADSENKTYVSKLHRKIWSLFKKKFYLPRYNELPAVKYQDGLDFINSLTLADMV